MIGNRKLAKFVTLVLLKGLGEDKPSELIATAIVRARFCELITEAIGYNDHTSDAFLVGLFSLMDALLDRPMNKILAELPLSDDISAALQRQPHLLTNVLETVIAYEQGNWDKFDIYRQTIKLSTETAKRLYLESISWVWEIEQYVLPSFWLT
jgi:EAL and modified HD-GYP domain-containing signal transduction protein